MSANTKKIKEGKPANPQVFPSLARLRLGFSLSNEWFFSRVNRLKNQNFNTPSRGSHLDAVQGSQEERVKRTKSTLSERETPTDAAMRQETSAVFQTLSGSRLKSLRGTGGFTLPEVVVTVTLFGVISVTFLGLMVNYFANITRNNFFVDMTTDSQNLLRSTVEELRYSAGVRQANTINDPNGPAGGWNTSNDDFVIVIAKPAQDSSGNFIIDTSTGNPYNNELVYFKDDNTLHRRTLAHPSAPGNVAVTSCPEAASNEDCPADVVLIENLDDMVFTLYDQDDAPTTNALLARSVKIDLTMVKDTFGDPLTLQNSIRVTQRNTY